MSNQKKEISKEAMFNKIMPSGPLSHNVAPNVKKSGSYKMYVDDRDERAAAAIAQRDKAFENVSEDAEQTEQTEQNEQNETEKADVKQTAEETSQQEKSPEKETEKETPQQEKTDTNENDKEKVSSVHIVNICEKMVDMKIDEAMEKFNCCTCSICRQSVICRTLNSLTPKYLSVEESDIDKIIEKEDFTEVTAALMKSILYLKANPNH